MGGGVNKWESIIDFVGELLNRLIDTGKTREIWSFKRELNNEYSTFSLDDKVLFLLYLRQKIEGII